MNIYFYPGKKAGPARKYCQLLLDDAGIKYTKIPKPQLSTDFPAVLVGESPDKPKLIYNSATTIVHFCDNTRNILKVLAGEKPERGLVGVINSGVRKQ